MSPPFGEADYIAQPPLTELSQALRAAEAGVMPAFTAEELLTKLGLDGEEPDGLTLAERLAGDHRDVATYRGLVELNGQTIDLIETTNDRSANEAQEALVDMFGTVVTTQITREGDICERAREIALASTRDDIISPELRAALEAPMNEDLRHLDVHDFLGAVLRQLFDAGVLPDPGDRDGDSPLAFGRVFVIPIEVDGDPFGDGPYRQR